VTLPVAMQPDVGLAAYVDEVGDNPAVTLNAALASRLAALINASCPAFPVLTGKIRPLVKC